MASDPNEDLEELRTLSSSIIQMLDSGDTDISGMAEDLSRAVIRLDINCLNGSLPDGWAMQKLSKSKSADPTSEFLAAQWWND